MFECVFCGAAFPDDTYLTDEGICGSEVCQNKRRPNMYSIFLERNGQREFYAAISDMTPHPIIRATVGEIAEKNDCTVFVRLITSTGHIEEWTNLTIP